MEGINFTFTPQLGLLLGGIAGMLIGWVMGFFDSNNRTAKKIESAEANAEIARSEAERKIAEANQKLAQAPAAQVIAQDDPGLLRLKNNSGTFVLEMDGTPINSTLSPEKKKRLIDLITIIRPWLEGGLPPQAPPVSVQTPQRTPIQPAVSSSQPPATPVAGKKPELDIKSLSIVQQIDTVLQARLLNTPYAKSGIRLQESLQGGVEVYVGLEKFLSVDDVTDAAIKAVIRAAITEWEEKYTPGL